MRAALIFVTRRESGRAIPLSMLLAGFIALALFVALWGGWSRPSEPEQTDLPSTLSLLTDALDASEQALQHLVERHAPADVREKIVTILNEFEKRQVAEIPMESYALRQRTRAKELLDTADVVSQNSQIGANHQLPFYRKLHAFFLVLSEQYPNEKNYLEDLYHSYNRLSELAWGIDDFSASRAYAQSALDLADQRLKLEISPLSSLQWQYAQHNILISIERKVGDSEAARRHHLMGLEVANERVVIGKHEPLYQLDLVKAYGSFGTFEESQGNFLVAAKYFRSGLEIAHALFDLDPSNEAYQQEQALLLNGLGNIEIKQGNLDAAWEYFDEGMALQESLVEQDPESWLHRRSVALSYNKMGNVARRSGDLEQAYEYYNKSAYIREKLVEAYPDFAELKNDVAASYYRMGLVAWEANLFEKARDYFGDTLELYRALHGNTDAGHGPISLCLLWLGNAEREMGNTTTARTSYEQSLVKTKALLKQDVGNGPLHRQLVFIYEGLGKLSSNLDETGSAIQYYEVALDELQNMRERQSMGEGVISKLEDRIESALWEVSQT